MATSMRTTEGLTTEVPLPRYLTMFKTHTHSCMHTHTHTHMHAHSHTRTRMHTHYTHTLTLALMCTHMHTHTRTRAHTHTHTHTHTLALALMRTHMHTHTEDAWKATLPANTLIYILGPHCSCMTRFPGRSGSSSKCPCSYTRCSHYPIHTH